MAFSPYECARDRISPLENVHMSNIEMTTNESKKKEERKEDMNKDKMYEGCKINKKMKLKQRTKHLKDTMLQSIK